MKPIAYVEKYRIRDELVNRIMHAAMQITNFPDIVEPAIRSILRRPRFCIETAGENC